MLDLISILSIACAFTATFLATFIATPYVAAMMNRHGITGRDVHKRKKTEIPEMGGLAILLSLTIGTVVTIVVLPNSLRQSVAFIGVVLIAGAIGIVDDLHPLGARTKPILTALACLPILLLRTYNPFPVIPLIGSVRLTLLYPLLVLVAIAVTSNAVNMMDVMNGSMAGTVAIVAAAITTVLILSGEVSGASLAAALLAAMLAFYYFNRFPAKIFGGDTGSLAVGAALGALSILGGIETVVLVALIPQIMNAFYGLASVGGLRERREILQRPVILLRNGLIKASPKKGAPVTLVRLILASGPLSERDIVRGMMILTAVSSMLAVLTYLLMGVGRV